MTASLFFIPYHLADSWLDNFLDLREMGERWKVRDIITP